MPTTKKATDLNKKRKEDSTQSDPLPGAVARKFKTTMVSIVSNTPDGQVKSFASDMKRNIH